MRALFPLRRSDTGGGGVGHGSGDRLADDAFGRKPAILVDAAVRRLERDPAAERERRFDGDPVERHREIGAREAIPMYVTDDRLGELRQQLTESVARLGELEAAAIDAMVEGKGERDVVGIETR
jgi:hypothetical protein